MYNIKLIKLISLGRKNSPSDSDCLIKTEFIQFNFKQNLTTSMVV